MTEKDIPSNLLTASEVEEPEEVPKSVPFTNVRIKTDTIIEYFLKDVENAARYESSKKYEYWARGKAALLIVIGYFSLILLSFGLAEYTSIPENTRSYIAGGVFSVLALAAAVIWVFRKIFENRANSLNITYPEAVYYESVSAIDDFKNQKYEYSINHLDNLKDLLELSSEEETPYNSNFESELMDYLKQISNEESTDFLQDTFPPIADVILRYLVIVQYSDFSRLYTEDEDTDVTAEINWYDHIRSYFGSLTKSRYVRRIGPYVIIAPIVVGIAFLYSPTWANIVAILSLGIIEGHHRVIKEEQ